MVINDTPAKLVTVKSVAGFLESLMVTNTHATDDMFVYVFDNGAGAADGEWLCVPFRVRPKASEALSFKAAGPISLGARRASEGIVVAASSTVYPFTAATTDNLLVDAEVS